jgi:formyl-CoA transferase
MDEMFADPQVQHLGMAADVHSPKLGDIQVVRNAIEMTRTPHRIAAPTPERGANTDEVLREIGYAESEITDLHARHVV